MNRSGPVVVFCRGLMKLRAERGLNLHAAGLQGRALAMAVADEVAAKGEYCPERDKRVLWARQVIAAALYGAAVPRASLELEATVDFMINEESDPRVVSGKELAAGGDR